jgi:hypothetical protein
LGEILVKAGKIDEAQLASVLERQLTMGGRLGTNLIELGYVTEQELTDFLSKKLNFPSATIDDFKNIDPKVVKKVPAEVSKKYRMMPLRQEGNTLIVAMVDPTDFDAASELAFITSCMIRPCVATEARIQYAHETHYGILRQVRYVSVLDEERREKVDKTGGEGAKTPASRPSVQKERPEVKQVPSPEALEEALKIAKKELAQVISREDVTAVLLRNLSLLFDRTVFFVVNKEAIVGFETLKRQINQNAVRSLKIPLAEGSIFRETIERRELCYRSPQGGEKALDSSPGNIRLIKALGGLSPFEVLVAPVIMRDNQVVALLYGDNLSAPRARNGLAFIEKLMTKASIALEILILQRKLFES